VVEHDIRSQLLDPFLRLRARRRRQHPHRGERLHELDEDRTDAARGADDQDRAGRLRVQPQLVEEGLPRGDRRQRKRCRLGEAQARRLPSADALVDQLATRVRTRPIEAPGVVDVVARAEHRHLLPHPQDGSRRVPSEDPFSAARTGGSDLHVDRIDRHGLDLDEKVMTRRRSGCGDLSVDEAVGRVDRPSSTRDDRFDHRRPVRLFREHSRSSLLLMWRVCSQYERMLAGRAETRTNRMIPLLW